MDPNERQSTKWKDLPAEEKLAQLRRLRDVPHKLGDENHLFDQNWFIGAVTEHHLEQAYMNDISMNNLP